SHADAVKIEGGLLRADTVRALVQNGIPVLGHIGLTPQNIKEMGGYRVQGRASKEADALIQDARALEEAGAFAIVLECIPAALGKTITESLQIPTIGIGAGKSCDGQVLVTSDLLGIQSTVQPKFVKRYAEVGEAMSQAFTQYIKEVKDGAFPADEHEY
ncbi:MAG: 3-methyl-2-oxobutanoate hydroxymethyltransferase, partial [Kiritimatiellae bacterium]|nr:3-methyl-2-oxobutanoate hydroxymethyltransferase [Kiritimatiellia bacterium]